MSKENFFSSKMKVKSDEDLLFILKSKDYVPEAKHAAQWELEKRGKEFKKLSIPVSIEKEAERYKISEEIYERRRKEFRKFERKHYGSRLLYFGISLIVMAFVFLLPPMLTSKKSLITLDGPLKGVVTNYEEVESTSRWGYTSTSIKASLKFFLKNHTREFSIFKNIGQDRSYPKYTHIKRKMESSDLVTVWIKRSKKDRYSPKVYQIRVDDEIVLKFNEVRFEYLFGFVFAIVLGCLCALPILKQDHPEVYRKILFKK